MNVYNNNNYNEFLELFAKIAKQWGIGETAGRVWGLLLIMSKPLTQEEIVNKIHYSRGLVSRALKKLRELRLIGYTKKGREFYYYSTTSFVNGFNRIVQYFIVKDLNPVLKKLRKIGEHNKSTTLSRLFKEYKSFKDYISRLTGRR